jgi:hypothetical protein
MTQRKSTEKNTLRGVKEIKVEKYLLEQVNDAGGVCVKLEPNLYPGIFDRLVVLNGTHFIELKRPIGGRLSGKQKRFRERLTRQRALWHVINTCEEVDKFIMRNSRDET